MELNIETKIALIGLCITSVFAVIGLFLNFLALRQNNRIAVSTKLAEASRILSDELVDVCRATQLMERELKEAEAHPDSKARTKKIDTLSILIAKKKERQAEIDQEQDWITELFKDVNKVDPGQVDEVISVSYSHQALARSSHDLIKEIKSANS